ncbi:MAG: CRISPR-associated endoribonuclease Cas6 [Stenomitos frigidus ULC029]
MPSVRKAPRRAKPTVAPSLQWASATELVGLTLTLQPEQNIVVSPQYTTELHSWFLDQVRRLDHDLSTRLHDGQSEKPFTVSSLSGAIQAQGRSLLFATEHSYQWTLTALSRPVVAWLEQWLQTPPPAMQLRSGTFHIRQWTVAHPPATYTHLRQTPLSDPPTVTLTFASPTSFRRRGNHLPLPMPANVFQSYLRRWNDFSGQAVDQEDFLAWVEECVIILRHQLQSTKVVAGKSGSVTGFTGSVQFGLSAKARQEPDYVQQWLALGQLAPYCGTGHKTTFGLGQTQLGWSEAATATVVTSVQDLLGQRTAALTARFLAQRQRLGGDRASHTAETWATILARREMGESLQTIAQDLEMPYETVKTYVKLARRALTAEATTKDG